MSRHPRIPFSIRAQWPSDHRDELVAAALVGLVVVLLGYASGIGLGGTNSSAAAGGPSAVIAPASPSPTGPSPVIVRATGGDGNGGDNGYGGGYGSGYGAGTGTGSGTGVGSGTGNTGAGGGSTTPVGSPSTGSGSSTGATSSPIIVGSTSPASPTPSGLLPVVTSGLGTLTGTLTSTVNEVLCGLLGVCVLSQNSTASAQ